MPTGKKQPFAKRSLGQNFLVDPNYIQKIIDAVDPQPGDTILEIGPGRGAITDGLVATEAAIVALELDRDFVPMLRDRFRDNSNFTIHEADAVTAEFDQFVPNGTKVVANLPYYISTAILQRLAEQRELFSGLTLMFQREVVDRISADVGNSDRGYLTVLVEAAFTVERLFDVPPRAFRPAPKVTSSVVKLTPKPPSIADSPNFRELVSRSFGQKRKTLHNNLKAYYTDIAAAFAAAEIDPGRRAETLALDEWLQLFAAITK
jgi:16S rRNA (adenine1518-N6/adenine1519-N6)-dimethyltransferase